MGVAQQRKNTSPADQNILRHEAKPSYPSLLWSFGFLLIALVCLFTYCVVVSRGRILWLDELLGWTLVTDPSWRHMVAAWDAGADGGGLAYYLLCRVWLLLFGKSVLSFRLFSAAGTFAGFAGMYFALARFYTREIVAVALFVVWFGSFTILSQATQGRFYGLLLGASAWAFLAAIRSAVETFRWPNALLALAANALLVETHTFGIFYCLAILAGSALSDWKTGRRRLWFYVCALAPAPLLIFSIPAIRSSSNLARPWFWTARPDAADLIRMYVPTPLHTALGLGVAAVALIIALHRPPKFQKDLFLRSALLVPAFVLLTVPAFIWVLSQHGTSYFVERYFIPCAVGCVAVVGELLFQLFGTAGGEARTSASFRWFSALTLAYTGWSAVAVFPTKAASQPFDLTPALAQALPPHVPVIVEQLELLAMMKSGSYSWVPSRYVLDWPTALADDSPRGFVNNYKEMATWRELGYGSSSVMTYKEVFDSLQRFAVVDCNCSSTFDERFLKRTGWKATHLADVSANGERQSVWYVERLAAK